MTDLHITWPSGQGRFSPADSPVAIGRASTAAVPLTEGSVSRQHLSLEWAGAQWVVADNSTHGTFDPSGVRLPRQWALPTEISIHLGGTEGVLVRIQSAMARPTVPAPSARPEEFNLFPPSSSNHISADPPVVSSPGGLGQAQPQPQPRTQYQPQPEPQTQALFGEQPSRSDLGGTGLDPSGHQAPPAPLDPSPAPGFGDAATDTRAASPDPGRMNAGPSGAGAGLVRLEPDPPPGPSAMFDSIPSAPGILDPSPPMGSSPPQIASSDLGRNGHSPPPALSGGPNATMISDSALRLNVAGQDYSFVPGTEVTVGRDPSCLVQLDERHSLVSRRHLRIAFRDGHWWIEDSSSKGTFIDGRPLKGAYKAEGAFVATLGDDDAGTVMRVITAGEHRAPRNRTPLILAILAVVGLLALGALALSLSNRSQEVVAPDLEAAKRSTVVLFGLDGGQGSGFFVSENLILTNQHVAVLSPQMLVGVSREIDAPAQIEYATELVANHPFLDISVLRVSNRATVNSDGPNISTEPVGDIGIPPVALGDSNDISIGDAVFSTGFPGRLTITSTDESGALRLPSVVLTNGEAANFTIWPGCSNPEFAAFIPADSPPGVACSNGGDIERGVLLSTFSSGQGASGSAVFRNNEVVAVVYAGAANEDNASLNITTAAFGQWLNEIIAANP